MPKIIDIDKTAKGTLIVKVDTGVARSIHNANNIIVKPVSGGTVIKLSDESWRQHVYLDDTVRRAGVSAGTFTTVDQLTTYLRGVVGE